MNRGTRWLIALAIVAFVLTPVIASAATESTSTSRGQAAAQPSSHTTRDIGLTGIIVVPIVALAGIAAGTGRRHRRHKSEPIAEQRSSGPNAAWRSTARVITNPMPETVPVRAAQYQRIDKLGVTRA